MVLFLSLIETDAKEEVYKKYKESLERFGFTPLILNLYEPKYKALSKLGLMREFLDSADYEDDDVMVWSDSQHNVFVKDPKNLEDEFKATGHDLIFGCDLKPTYLENSIISLTDGLYSEYVRKYLCNSFCIGYMSKIHKMLVDITDNIQKYSIKNYWQNDQRVLANYLFSTIGESDLNFSLDTECKFVFNNSTYEDRMNFTNYKSYCVYTPDNERADLVRKYYKTEPESGGDLHTESISDEALDLLKQKVVKKQRCIEIAEIKEINLDKTKEDIVKETNSVESQNKNICMSTQRAAYILKAKRVR
jgi:hypothetical protein